MAQVWFENVSKRDANALVSWWNSNSKEFRYFQEKINKSKSKPRYCVKRVKVNG